MHLTKAARKKLGDLLDRVDCIVADLIRERGGTASNVREAGHWAGETLGNAAAAAADGDRTAVKAIKIVKDARRLGEKH
jgi:hypothetical protein